MAQLPVLLHRTSLFARLWSGLDWLRAYLLFYAPDDAPALPGWFQPMAGLFSQPFLTEGYVVTVLCEALLGFLAMITSQRARRKRACGGYAHPNRFTPADLRQSDADLPALAAMTSQQLCDLLLVELRLLLRVMRAAQRAFWKQKKGWWHFHRAAALVFKRVLHVCAELRKRANRFYAEQCVREALRLLWEDQFGPNLPAPSEVHQWLRQRADVPEQAEPGMLRCLLQEQAQGHPTPDIFLYLLEESGA
ncbi:MAG TPA: hypothetical protein VH540_25945 [Ktedonobacterales bacterium]|jgi:hypothetical protein